MFKRRFDQRRFQISCIGHIGTNETGTKQILTSKRP
jgi:hypothetical protein